LNEGVVVAVGKGALNKDGNHIPLQLASGDRVILPPFGGSNVKVAGEVSKRMDLLLYSAWGADIWDGGKGKSSVMNDCSSFFFQ
jgi:hypothetical protein